MSSTSIPDLRKGTKLTVLCVTTGRSTLDRALRSLMRQDWQADDEVWLVHDGPDAETAKGLWDASRLRGHFIILNDGPHQDWGHSPRNQVLPMVSSGYVVNLDDDDALAPGALSTIRSAIAEQPGAFFFFRVCFPDGTVLWVDQDVREGNIGTGLFVHPAGIPLGSYTPRYGGDFDFVAESLRKNPDRPVVWRKEAHYLVRPDQPWKRSGWVDGRDHAHETGREDCQKGWHHFFGQWFQCQSILDVGAGQGLSKSRLASGGNTVTTHDVVPGLPVDIVGDLVDLPDDAYDVVTAFDVIEHTLEPAHFIAELNRIARRAIVLTTPNVWVSHCQNVHHVREYSPPAFLDLVTNSQEQKSVELMASAQWSGVDPVVLLPENFLGTMLPVLAAVISK